MGRALSSATLASYRFRIEGHTDTVGTPDANKALSERRAQAVVDFLADRFQIDRSRLEPEGMGQDGLLVQTPPQTPEMRNRRCRSSTSAPDPTAMVGNSDDTVIVVRRRPRPRWIVALAVLALVVAGAAIGGGMALMRPAPAPASLATASPSPSLVTAS